MIEPHIIDKVAIERAKEDMDENKNELSYNLPDNVILPFIVCISFIYRK